MGRFNNLAYEVDRKTLELRSEKMTLQRLTNILQDLCHHGHAQDEVDFVTGNVVRVTDHIEIKQCPYKDKTISFRIDAEEEDQC